MPNKVTPSVTLSATGCTWNGKAQKPSVTKVRAGDKQLTASDYTVSYVTAGSKNIGRYAVKVELQGNYRGTGTAYYTINPKGTSLKKVTAKKKALTVKWAKQSAKMPSARIGGYQVQVALDSKFTKGKKTVTVKGYSKTSKKVTKLKKKTRYYVHVRTYMKVGGKTYYSAWSKAKVKKTK